ncbi:hypothetical protein ACJ2A9_10570 [Anaerobacillus sp. MEB173]|uniref:hypothetical protein n=1 Tax=Anaerobacillus sp. MEB173 TaxID=3383345 RepID=UPI003F9083E5
MFFQPFHGINQFIHYHYGPYYSHQPLWYNHTSFYGHSYYPHPISHPGHKGHFSQSLHPTKNNAQQHVSNKTKSQQKKHNELYMHHGYPFSQGSGQFPDYYHSNY